MPQLWQGRASKAVDSRVNDFNSSIRFDARMIEQDIQGSLVHSAMLGRQGIISRQDVDDIHKGLHSILDDLHSGALEIDPNAEDVHTFVEQTLTARVGDAGKRLHTGRSRNDQVALDIRLNLRAAGGSVVRAFGMRRREQARQVGRRVAEAKEPRHRRRGLLPVHAAHGLLRLCHAFPQRGDGALAGAGSGVAERRDALLQTTPARAPARVAHHRVQQAET